jgi:uncharacterized protein with FMN-binding domain
MHSFLTRAISVCAIALLLLGYNGTLSLRGKDQQIAQLTEEKAAAQQVQQEADPASADAAASAYKDGTYTGTGQGFGGEIVAEVKIENGSITSVNITSHSGEDGTYFSMAEKLTDTIVEKQSADVDLVSGATFSSTGIRDAAQDALNRAKQ